MQRKKRVAYLFGAGATQGEIMSVDPTFSLLTQDVTDGMISKIAQRNIKILNEVRNELTSQGANIEHLISLYESAGTAKCLKVAAKLKELFREEILERLEKHKGLKPTLHNSIIDMHQLKGFEEEITGILTLNYDDIAESSIQYMKSGVNFFVQMNRMSGKIKPIEKSKSLFPYLKLHGSFNWKKDYPIALVDQHKIRKESDVLWIPPGVEKNKERYPYNVIWHKAKELLTCDVLRVIGCSLNRNDWQLVSLLFSMQKINGPNNFVIEMIASTDSGNKAKKEYPYLRIHSITEIAECDEYLRDRFSIKADSPLTSTALDELSRTSNPKLNIFDWWLRAKGFEVKKKGIALKTKKRVFENFVQQNNP